MAKQKMKITTEDYVKANKALARQEEMELLGPGFHSKTKVHKSKKAYTRKDKHKSIAYPYFFGPFRITSSSYIRKNKIIIY